MSELKLQQCRVDGRYDVLDCLGRGSYSEVYVARDVAAADGAPVMIVLKALNTYLQGAPDPELEQTLIDNFRNEAVPSTRAPPQFVITPRQRHAIDAGARSSIPLLDTFRSVTPRPAAAARSSSKASLFYLEPVCSGLEHCALARVSPPHRSSEPAAHGRPHRSRSPELRRRQLGATDWPSRASAGRLPPPEHHPEQTCSSTLPRSPARLHP